MDTNEFYTIIKNIDGYEEIEEYDDLYEARSDYVNFVNHETNYNYIVLQHVEYIEGVEYINIIDEKIY